MKFICSSIIIATSQNRIEWLINRSLNSVYNQIGIDKSKCKVFIIDDNKESDLVKIEKRIFLLRNKLNLKKTEFPTVVLKNTRTKFMSGTGAWNTGIFESYKLYPEGYISILDDDDEYLPNHMFECISAIKISTVAVFQQLLWFNDDNSTKTTNLKKENLTAENFFIGNPGIQGSNMFFKTKSLVEIGAFDETLPNTTDRDLMIRFLWKNQINKIEIIEKIGVIHYNHNKEKVNNDISKKQFGLDIFYKKYKANFSNIAYKKSLVRAKSYFNYTSKE